MKIRVYPDIVLRKKSKPVYSITPEIRQTLKEMSETMYISQGVGLAAPQVGINKQLIVLDTGRGLSCLINPRIIKKSGASVLEEGCLSFPGITVRVKRPAEVIVEARDAEGKDITLHGAGLLAHVLQHEIDHLAGRLIIDYAGLRDKWRIRRRLKEMVAEHASQNNFTCSKDVKCL